MLRSRWVRHMPRLVNLRNRLVANRLPCRLFFFAFLRFYCSWQVDSLRMEIETQNKKKDALEARANMAEKKIHELNLKLESVSHACFSKGPHFFFLFIVYVTFTPSSATLIYISSFSLCNNLLQKLSLSCNLLVVALNTTSVVLVKL